MTQPHVVVIGGTKGLGRVITERFQVRGSRVTVVSRGQDPTTLDATFGRVIVDLETLEDPQETVQQILDSGGPLQYLVFSQRYRGTGDSWQGEIQVGLTATKLLIDGLQDHFSTEGDRAIGLVSSAYAQFTGSSQPLGYHVVKAGLNHLVRHYARVLGPNGIRVNAIMPFTYLKAESKHSYLSQPELLSVYERMVPLGRMGTTADSADVLDFLCSEKAAFVNGQCIFVDGGLSVIWPEEMAWTFSGK